MIFNSVSAQVLLFVKFYLFAFASGLLITCGFIIKTTFKSNFYVNLIVDTFITVSFTTIFLYITNIWNFGEFRIFLCLSFVFGIITFHITIGKLFAKLILFIYNKLKTYNEKFKQTAIGKILYK